MFQVVNVLTLYEGCLFAQRHCSLGAVKQEWENNSGDVREPAALLQSSTVKRMEEGLFQLCTTSFMASFIQMKAWQTYSSLFL